MNIRRDRLSMVLITLAIAMVLTLFPCPTFLDPLRPYWVALVLIYWCLETQDLISLGLAFVIGLVLDLLTGSLFGQHALSLVVLVYLVTRFRARLRFFPPWQQALSVLALLLNDRIILLWIISLRGEPLPSPDVLAGAGGRHRDLALAVPDAGPLPRRDAPAGNDVSVPSSPARSPASRSRTRCWRGGSSAPARWWPSCWCAGAACCSACAISTCR